MTSTVRWGTVIFESRPVLRSVAYYDRVEHTWSQTMQIWHYLEEDVDGAKTPGPDLDA
jgi:hypothetical protein